MADRPIDELSARRLTIVDGQGRGRATLGPAEDGSVELRLYDADDRARAELTVGANGVTSLTLRDGDGEMRSCLAVGAEGDTRLHLHGTAAVSLHDREGQPRALLGLDEQTGMASLSCADAAGGTCVLLAEDESGGRLHLFRHDADGRRIPAGDPADPEASDAVTVHVDAASPAPEPGRRGRRWLRAALLVVLSASAGAAGGRLAILQLPPPLGEPPSPPRRIESLVSAREIELSDPAGIPRVRLSALPDGTPLLWMTDGSNTVEIGAMSDVGAVLRLKGATSSVELVAPPRDPPSVSASANDRVLFQAPSNVARFLPQDLWPEVRSVEQGEASRHTQGEATAGRN
jgi:hypothetical protein